MTQTAAVQISVWPLIVYFAAVLLVIVGMLTTSHFLGERRKGLSPMKSARMPYESGMIPTGSTQVRLSVTYYLIAMFFLVFDLEAAVIFAWAVAVREAGWPGYVEMLVFIVILMAGLAYLWREGALDWGPRTAPSRARGGAHR